MASSMNPNKTAAVPVASRYDSYTSQDFKQAFELMVAANDKAYKLNPSITNPVYPDYTLERIREILASGNVKDLRELSDYFYRFSGIYKRIINYFSTLLSYDAVVTPNFKFNLPKNKALTRINQALSFVKDFNIKVSCKHMAQKIFYEGAYYGLLRVYPDSVTLQDLPFDYCRTRFKNKYGMSLIEFDLRFFDTIFKKEPDFKAILESFPLEIMQGLYDYKTGVSTSPWFIVPSDIGVCFYYEDLVPYFTPILPAIYHYDDTQDRELDRDKEELQKILINKMPLSKTTDEPVFDLEEMKEMHTGMVDMLKGNKYIDVITSFGELTLEQAQDMSGQAQRDSLAKFKRTVYDEAGTSAELFNAEGNTGLTQAINKDMSLAISIADLFADWLSFQLNLRFGDSKLDFSLSFLPITAFNRKEMAAIYANGANYGYSKIYAGVAYGIEQYDLVNMVTYENDILDLPNRMIPLQSSFTSSGSEKNSGKTSQKSVSKAQPDDTSNEGGRPSSGDENKTSKTIANQNSE